MPNPKQFKSKKKFLKKCIPMVIHDKDKTPKQAAGQCYGMWKNKGESIEFSKFYFQE